MRNLRVAKRGDDMPLYGTMTRLRKGSYVVVIKFVASKRTLQRELLLVPTRKEVKRFFEREYPTLTWGVPKYTKRGKLRNPRSKRK